MKLSMVIKSCYYLLLVCYVLYPKHIVADGTPPIPTFGSDASNDSKRSKPDKDKDKDSDKNAPPKKETKNDEAIIGNLFNNATYENFVPQEEKATKKIVDEKYLDQSP
jgi:hypothetical protein